MTLCTPMMIAAFVLHMHPGQVYMGDNGDFHMGISGDLNPPLMEWPDRGMVSRCYAKGKYKGQCIGLNTYRVTIEVVDVQKRAFRYTSTVKMADGGWRFSKVGRWTDVAGLCGRVADKEMVLDARKGL